MSKRVCECGKPAKAHGLCMAHYRRMRRNDPEYAERDRESSRRWKREHRERNRARDRARAASEEKRGTCEVCGGPMGVGHFTDGTCTDCRAELHELRWQRIEAMWAEGRSVLAIAHALGNTKGCVAGEMAQMRAAGRALPYRYRNTKLQRVAA